MKKILLAIFLGIFLVSLISSMPICVDKDPPSAPSNLAVTSSGTNIILTWNPATDVPECSGIDYYNVARDGNLIAEHITALTYTNLNVPYGTYSYSVWAFDKVGHDSGPAIKNDVVLSAPTSGGGGGGGTRVSGGHGADSYVCYEEWQCSTWGGCINERQTRVCTDLNYCGTSDNKPIISRGCSVEETIPLTTSSTDFLTGAVTGITDFVLSPGGSVVTVFIVLIIGGAIAVLMINRRGRKK